jgi:hypothetical protein
MNATFKNKTLTVRAPVSTYSAKLGETYKSKHNRKSGNTHPVTLEGFDATRKLVIVRDSSTGALRNCDLKYFVGEYMPPVERTAIATAASASSDKNGELLRRLAAMEGMVSRVLDQNVRLADQLKSREAESDIRINDS